MKAAGFGAVFCNIKDYPLSEWDIVRERARAAGVICGPWARTTNGNEFEPNLLHSLIECAEDWGDVPYIVNSESELKGSGADLTDYINQMCGADDYALSMEPIPFANVDWTPIKAPVLPQCFGPEYAGIHTGEVITLWRQHGIRCVVPTFGTYSGWQPSLYSRLSPYGLYTADDCASAFAPWSPQGELDPCQDTPTPPNGGDMPDIGYQDGITAAMNRLRDLDPKGTVLAKGPDGKWPGIETLTTPVDQWKAYDKLERTLTILKDDHDAA
jgi:hypothetical protein